MRIRLLSGTLLLVICAGCAGKSAAAGETDSLPRYLCHRAPAAVSIDGQLDEAEWAAAEWTSAFVDVRGPSFPAPRYATRSKLLWDDENLYVAAEMEEPDVWGTLTRKGSKLYEENNFEVFLDPLGRARNYWEFEINPLGTTWDLQMSKPYSEHGGPIPGSGLAGVKSAVTVQGTLNKPGDKDQGWTTEIAIPWTSLTGGLPPRDADEWRMLLCRIEWKLDASGGSYKKIDKSDEYWSWSPIGEIAFHVPRKWGMLKFSARPATRSAQ